MKLYIPTSSLNFDNILSSESIAPAALYPQRGYGYRTFDIAEGVNYHNKIVLMSKIPEFSIDDEMRENYPMIIEVDIPDSQRSIYEIIPLPSEHDFELFITNQTIYLSPLTCAIYFLDTMALSSIYLKLSDSLTLKTGMLYRIEIAPKEIRFLWKNSALPKEEINQTQLDISESVARDDTVNRVKGFWFAYIGGLLQSVSSDIAKLRKICREVYNITSSIINDINRVPFSFIEKLNSLKAEFYASDPNRIMLNEIFTKLHPNPEGNEIVKYYGERWLKDRIIENEKIDLYRFPDFSNNLSKPEWENVNDKARTFKVATLIDIYQLKDMIESVTTDKLRLTKLSLPNLDEKQHELYCILLNEFFFCKNGITAENIRINKKELGDEITRKIKSCYDDNEWIEKHKEYFTKLRENIARATHFDLTSTNDIIEQSIAAFLLKGDDLAGLREYLENNGIGDLSFAYGLWGAALGFANMPKILTNNLFSLADSDYISDIYKYIYYQVHGFELEGKIERKPEVKFDIVPLTTTIETSPLSPQETIKDSEIKSKLKNARLPDAKIKSIITVLSENNYSNNAKTLTAIGQIKGIGKKTFEKIINILGFNDKSSQNKNNGFSLLQYTKYESSPELYKDTEVFDYVEFLLPNNQKIKQTFKDDLDWFQGNHKEKYYDKNRGEQPGYYSKEPKDNNSTIFRYKKHLENKKTKEKWLRDIYNEIDIDKIISHLKKRYL